MADPITLTIIGKVILTAMGISSPSAAAGTAVGVALASAAVISVTYLTIRIIKPWFEERRSIIAKPGNIPFTFKDKLESGEKAIIQGIFNEYTDKVKDARIVKYKKLGSELKNLKKLEIYRQI